MKWHKGDFVKRVTIELCKNENGEYYVRLNDSKHACEPRKYEPEKYAKKEIQKCYDFFFFRQKQFPKSLNVAIYHPEDNTLCYRLNCNKVTSQFKCTSCKREGHNVFFAGIKKDENGKEYFNHDCQKHVCQPTKVSSICGPEFVILERDEINFEEMKRTMINFDERKIIESSLFEIFPNQKGVPDASLFIFLSEDRIIGHRYTYRKEKKYYTCYKSSLCHATAKLRIQENGEMYVVMGKTEHRCQPLNFMQT